MAQRQRNKPTASVPPPGRLLIGLIIVLMGWIIAAIAANAASVRAAASPSAPLPPPPARADAAVIKAEISDILSDSKYAAHRSLLDWLAEKLRSLRPDGIRLPREASAVVFWLVVAGCSVLVIALLVHVALTLRLSWGWRVPAAAGLSGPRLGSDADYRRPFDDLDGLCRRLASEGRFREALGIMMLALLRRHDDLGILRFHRSKTNGEYVREYPREHACRDDFRRFVLAFDLAVYGGRISPQNAFYQMNTLFQRMIIDAGKKPEN